MKLNLEEIFAIIDKVTANKLDLFSYEDEETKLKIKGSNAKKKQVFPVTDVVVCEERSKMVGEAEAVQTVAKKEEISTYNKEESSEVEKQTIERNPQNEKTIVSPMVGTFYAAPAVGAKAFVQVGDQIQEGQVVCIIEAMKLMNEIEAECSGIVEEILVKNEDAVEYGQPLIRVRVQ